MIEEIKHGLLQKVKTMKQGGQAVSFRPKRYILWKDVEEELDYWIKEEEK